MSPLLNSSFINTRGTQYEIKSDNTKTFLVLTIICFTLLLDVAESAKAVEYEYTELLPPGWMAASIFSYDPDITPRHIINDDGVVVGTGYKTYTNTWGPLSGFIYYQGEYTEVLLPGWEYTIIWGINNHGEVIGTAGKAGTAEKDPERAGFIYKDEIYTELQPQGFSYVTIVAINEKGTVLGSGINDSKDEIETFVYKAGKYMTLRPPLSPRTAHLRTVSDINDYGAIVGSCSTGSWWSPGIIFGFINRAGIYTKLSPKGYEHTEAIAINNRGQVIGRVAEEYNITGFIYRCGMYKWLNVPGTTVTQPWDINDHGEVVGFYGDFDAGFTKGFVYSNGTYTELLPPGWISSVASAINNNGVVVGCGTDGNQVQKMFIAEPQGD